LPAGRTVELHSTPIQHHHLLLLLLVRVMLTMCTMQESYTNLQNSKMHFKHATAVSRCLLLSFVYISEEEDSVALGSRRRPRQDGEDAGGGKSGPLCAR
jgi:hypothetical protein